MNIRAEASWWAARAERAELAALPGNSPAVLEVVRAFRRERLRQGAAATDSEPRWPHRPARRPGGAKNA